MRHSECTKAQPETPCPNHYTASSPDCPILGSNKRAFTARRTSSSYRFALCFAVRRAAMLGQTKEPWLRTFLEMPHGIPSHDTFKRLLSALAPESFLEAFMRWTQSLRRAVADELVAIDGKALRRAIDAGQPTNPSRLETKPGIRPPRLPRNLPSHLSQRELPKGAHGNFTIKNINRPNNPTTSSWVSKTLPSNGSALCRRNTVPSRRSGRV